MPRSGPESSKPMRKSGVSTKLGVIAALVAAVAVGPAVFAYVVGVCFSLDLSVVKDTYPVLVASVAYGLIITLSAGTFILALSSLSRRSLYVGIAWFGLWWISAAVGGILTEMRYESLRQEAYEHEAIAWIQENPPPTGTHLAPEFAFKNFVISFSDRSLPFARE